MGRRKIYYVEDTGETQKAKRREEDVDRDYFESCIKEMEEEEEDKTMPPLKIVKYHDLLDKLWGWDRLVPMGDSVSWSDYSHYLDAYYRNTKTAAKSLSIAAIAETCLKKEEELVSVWKIRKKSNMEMILPMSKSIILSCLIHQCANSVMDTENCKSSAVSNAALWCITKEADLTLELLRRDAHPCDDYLIDQSSEIRMCALSLMNCTLHNSVAASAAMLGIAKEAEMMCEWMGENHMLIDFYNGDPIPEVIVDGHIVRFRTLDVMSDMLEESAAAASASAGGGGHKIDGAANTAGGGISDVLNSHYQKIEGGKKSNKRKRNKDDVLGKLWGWGRLLPLDGSVEWSNYSNYLAEYYKQNALKFVAEQNPENLLLDPPARAVQIDTTAGSSLAAAVANHCVKMEEELVSKWKTRVPRQRGDTFLISTIIRSSLIKERALAICSTKGKFSVSSAIAFMCITKEADLMCELLKHGAEPTDDIIQQSSVIRMCALGLVNLKGLQSIASAAAMVGMAKEAKRMSDWMKRENKLLTIGLSEPCELEGRSIRTRTLDVMTSILLESSFHSEMLDDALAFY